ncbi:MAG TPA: hydroxymethylglutaryl-CoA lyase [Sphingomonadaceae bacterium]|nr:hydroxymethylglutaryl-CoA lyase [Sphingomonadaceae bacterium]
MPNSVEIVEVGPREGFQFEGMGDPRRIALADKLRLIEALAHTGLRRIQVVSFVSPRAVPQMADAEAICAALKPPAGVAFTGIYLNDRGLERALAAPNITIVPELVLSASEAFARRNQRRDFAQEIAMQRTMAQIYADRGLVLDTANIMAAFGSNMEPEIPLATVLEKIAALVGIAAETGSAIRTVNLADTMGWANPALVRRTVRAVRDRWPELRIGLHLHDTRGLGIANVYAALEEGVDRFDTGLGGLGGCPFAGNKGAAGNVSTEEVLFLCRELGIATGVDIGALIACARLAEEIVGHPLPSKLITSSWERAA